jgi:NADH:ubiquinone oxidoreductase subunit 6 (subunit J)
VIIEKVILDIACLLMGIAAVRATNPILNILGFVGVLIVLAAKYIGLELEFMGFMTLISYLAISITFFIIAASLGPNQEFKYTLPISNMKAVGGIILSGALLGIIFLVFEDNVDLLESSKERAANNWDLYHSIFIENVLAIQLLGLFSFVCIFFIILLLKEQEDWEC